MKNVTRLLSGLLLMLLVGCASVSTKAYDDGKIAQIERNVTTEERLLEWFGPATTRTLAPDGRKALTWKFAPANRPTGGASARLEVRLGVDGTVEGYSASSGSR